MTQYKGASMMGPVSRPGPEYRPGARLNKEEIF